MIPTGEKLTQTLREQRIPEPKARGMVKSVGRGLGLIMLGILLLTVAVATVGYVIFALEKEPALSVMLFAGFFGLAAVYFLIAGGNVISGQALDATANSPFFGLLARAIRLWKPKVPE